MKGRRVFFYVQHLLGIGHLRRTAIFANAVAARGIDVTLVSGGLAVPNLRLDGPTEWKPDGVGIFGPAHMPVTFDAGH